MPNVLLITSDQHNPFVCGYAGDPLVETPALDALAADGVVFGAAYTNNPICMPARASLATGRYGSTIGSYDARRAVFSEYHGPSSTAASYLLRRGRWKYIRHEREATPAQLFDVVADPDELVDRAAEPAMADLLAGLDGELCRIVDPTETDRRIRAEQAANLAAVAQGAAQPRRTSGGADLPAPSSERSHRGGAFRTPRSWR